MMDPGELCISCGYWVATIGSQCEACFDGSPSLGLEACVVASAIAWRRRLVPDPLALSPAAAALIDAVDALLREERSTSTVGRAGTTLRPSDPPDRRHITRGGP